MRTSYPWHTVSKSGCRILIALWWSTCNGSARILKCAKEPGNGCIDRFARAICRHEFLRGKNAASPPTSWTNGFALHSKERFGKCSWMKAHLCLGCLTPNPCEDCSKVTSPGDRTIT